jgi:hypothetical protein
LLPSVPRRDSRLPPIGILNLTAARQYRQREGHVRILRANRETVVDAAGVHHVLQLGVWRSNTRSRRAGLPKDQYEETAAIGLFA